MMTTAIMMMTTFFQNDLPNLTTQKRNTHMENLKTLHLVSCDHWPIVQWGPKGFRRKCSVFLYFIFGEKVQLENCSFLFSFSLFFSNRGDHMKFNNLYGSLVWHNTHHGVSNQQRQQQPPPAAEAAKSSPKNKQLSYQQHFQVGDVVPVFFCFFFLPGHATGRLTNQTTSPLRMNVIFFISFC